ncbi:hypothetical protein CQW39_30625 [Streptomyces griseofuscus]|uniref:Uncharacterized protein n=1 Tax=Streptomyces griseofuscus TaxID=146922 RepID=A0A426RWX9_9ACTN|nr:hypothetical protein CQW39_30625 [Streptomyces griseofuscus]RRQ79184.1 hypothetical protein CQW44_35090 [Streptomyces griseofuscus]
MFIRRSQFSVYHAEFSRGTFPSPLREVVSSGKRLAQLCNQLQRSCQIDFPGGLRARCRVVDGGISDAPVDRVGYSAGATRVDLDTWLMALLLCVAHAFSVSPVLFEDALPAVGEPSASSVVDSVALAYCPGVDPIHGCPRELRATEPHGS